MIPHEQRATAVALYAAGHSLKRVGRAVGVHLSTVAVWLRAAGVERRRVGRPRREVRS